MSTEKSRAIVLAAGRGVRMKSDLPKVLLPALGAPLLRYVLDALKHAGIDDVTLVVGHRAEEVRKIFGESYRYVHQTELKGTGDAVRRCAEAFAGFTGDVLVLCGDAPLVPPSAMKNLIELRHKTGAAAVLFTACLEDPRGYGRVARDAQGRFTRIVEELDATDSERAIFESNSGGYCFSAPELFATLQKVKADNKKGEYYLTEVPRILAEEGKRVETLKAEDPTEIFGVNTRRDLVAVTNFVRWKIMEHHLDQGVTIVDPSTTLIEPDVEIGEESTIEPFTILRRGTRIGKECHIGPFAHLRGGVTLGDRAEVGNFVEVKNSRIGTRSKAKHLSYLGDADLGSDVNIGCGTITANYDGKNKHRTTIGDNVHTGSNTVLVAPLTLGKGVKTGAGTVVPKGTIPAGALVVGVPGKIRETSGTTKAGQR